MDAYDPDRFRRAEPGGCRDTLLITRIAFEVLLPPLLALFAVVGLLVAALILFGRSPLLGLLPLLPLVAAVVWFVRRDRRLQEQAERDLDGSPR